MVRHGETELNSAERYWGRSDINLSASGLRQAERLRDYLAVEKIDAIYTSKLQRALVTAETIASRHQPAVVTCAELCEINFGELEGLTFDEISRLYPDVTRLWAQRSPRLKFPGGEGAAEFNERVGKFLKRLEKHAAEETILVVAHSGVLRTLMCYLLGLEMRYKWQFRLDLASLSVLETHQEGAVLTLLNSTSHLK